MRPEQRIRDERPGTNCHEWANDDATPRPAAPRRDGRGVDQDHVEAFSVERRRESTASASTDSFPLAPAPSRESGLLSPRRLSCRRWASPPPTLFVPPTRTGGGCRGRFGLCWHAATPRRPPGSRTCRVQPGSGSTAWPSIRRSRSFEQAPLRAPLNLPPRRIPPQRRRSDRRRDAYRARVFMKNCGDWTMEARRTSAGPTGSILGFTKDRSRLALRNGSIASSLSATDTRAPRGSSRRASRPRRTCSGRRRGSRRRDRRRGGRRRRGGGAPSASGSTGGAGLHGRGGEPAGSGTVYA